MSKQTESAGGETTSPKVYQSLTVEEPTTSKSGGSAGKGKDKWTLYLMLCCITASMSSYIFGFNIGATNLPTPLIKDFFAQRYFAEESVRLASLRVKQDEFDRAKNFYVLNDGIYTQRQDQVKKAEAAKDAEALKKAENDLNELNKDYNGSIAEYLQRTKEKLDLDEEEVKKLKQPSQKVEEFNTLLWTVTTSLFVVGGIVGAFTSKYVQDSFGRKKGILFHHLFTITGSVLVLIAPYINSPECVIISRFIYGVQGGMTCGLIPTYLSEISPNSLRGATGVIHQLFLTIGILTSQTLGFRQLLGTADMWHFLLAIPIVPGLLSTLVLLLFFPETPRALLLNNHDEANARIVLRTLRGTVDQASVENEIEEMKREARESKSSEAISLKDLFTLKELRWPLITGIVLQLTQQLCGINAVFFYSESIFKSAGVLPEHIQYAIFLTGAVNVLMTIVCVPLIDSLGRKPLLVYPMLMIIVDFIALTVFLSFQSSDKIYSYLCIACIIIFIMSFAVGLGPIPFVYVAESFRQDARSAALAICMFVNWVANLALTVTFPYLARLLGNYVFLVFTAIVLAAVIVIFKKVPETKGRSVEEIMAHFEGKKKPRADKDKAATEKLISK